MIVVDIQKQVDRGAWDERVRLWGGGTVYQTSYWGAYWSAYYRLPAHYLVVRDGQDIIGQLLLLEMLKGQESLPGGVDSPVAKIARPLLKMFIWWGGGPLVRELARRMEVLDACLKEMCALGLARGVIGVKEIHLPIGIPVTTDECATFSRACYDMAQRATVLLNIQKPIREIWDGLKKDVARTPVRQAQKHGVRLKQVESMEEIEIFCRLVSAWRRAYGFPAYGDDRYKKMWLELRPHCTFFLAQHAGAYVGGAGIFHFNKRAHLFTPVHSPDSRQQKIYVGDFLYWEMIRWCHEQGMEVFDFSGTFVHPSSPKEEGIRRFKGKWGGEVVEYPVFTCITKPGRWAFTDLAGKVRQTIRSLVAIR